MTTTKKSMITNLKSLEPLEEEFVDAASSGYTAKVRELLSRGVPVDVLDNRDAPMGQTALMHAAHNGHLEVVGVLLDGGANISAKDKAVPTFPEVAHGHQPLHYGVRSKNVAVAEMLLDAGANPNALNSQAKPPLNVAVQYGNLETVRLLLARGAKLNLRVKNKGFFPPLCAAASANQREIFNELMKAGADIHAVNPLNQTPLICAASAPEEIALPMIEALLNAGAKVDHIDKFGNTALFAAVFQQSSNVVKALAQAGADISRVFKEQGGTLLDAAEKRVQANQCNLDDPSSTEWEKNAAREGLEKWQSMFDLLRKLGAKRQSEL
jgi:ankyrin repeat protein